jgi:signal transduction histidine kinase
MVISSARANDVPGGLALLPLAAFAARIPADATPLLVFRAVDFAEVAWRRGRRAALRAERRCASAFARAAQHVLRASDVLGHDACSAVFVAALTTPGRGASAAALPADCRAALGRIASAMELATGLRLETGWTVEANLDIEARLAPAIEAAFERGAKERERYAFFSLIGHELRTPLTSIRGYLEALLEDDVDPATARTFLEVAQTEALRLGRFIEGLFELSLIDAGLNCAEQTCDAATAVAAALSAALPGARQREIALAHDLPCGLLVRIDPDRLVQVAGNVLENALKHGAAGGVVTTALRVADRRFVELTIEDDGPGVAAGERESIFVLGYRSAASGAGGTGIGLAVARLILERVGGEIDVIDGSRGGACFRIRLPRAEEVAPGAG